MEKMDSGLYVIFNRLNRELNLFKSRFFAMSKKVKDEDAQKEWDKRSVAELWCYYNNLLSKINFEIEDLETRMLTNFPDDLETNLLIQKIYIAKLEKKLCYYPENKVFMLEDMTIEEINQENKNLAELEGIK